MSDTQSTPQSKQKEHTGLFNESMKKAQKRTNEEIMRLKQQIAIQTQKNQRIQKQREEKQAKVYHKSTKNQCTVEENQDIEIPVDGEMERGSRIFMMHCSSCHSMQPQSLDKKMAPALGLIFNRKAGSDANYQGYSEALIKSNFYWTARNLYRFMYNPSTFIKGTTCRIAYGAGLKSEQDRADLLQFLREYSKELFMNIRIKQAKAKGYDKLQTQIYVQNEISKKKL